VKTNSLEAIKLIEQITASRFYTERGRNALIETVAYAMFLSAEEKDKVLAAQQPQYTKLQDVLNALLLLVGDRYTEEAEAVLRARADVLSTQQRLPYYDKSSWLVYVHRTDGNASDDEQFEVACFLCATNHPAEAYDRFLRLSANGNLSALWMALGLARQLGKEEDEARLLAELSALYDEGVLDYLPDEVQERIDALEADGYQCNATADYGRNKIGF